MVAKCPFADRECTHECKAYDESVDKNCLVLYRADRANKLLNFIDKKLERR